MVLIVLFLFVFICVWLLWLGFYVDYVVSYIWLLFVLNFGCLLRC